MAFLQSVPRGKEVLMEWVCNPTNTVQRFHYNVWHRWIFPPKITWYFVLLLAAHCPSKKSDSQIERHSSDCCGGLNPHPRDAPCFAVVSSALSHKTGWGVSSYLLIFSMSCNNDLLIGLGLEITKPSKCWPHKHPCLVTKIPICLLCCFIVVWASSL